MRSLIIVKHSVRRLIISVKVSYDWSQTWSQNDTLSTTLCQHDVLRP